MNNISDRGFKIDDYIYYERPLIVREKNEYNKKYIIGKIKEIAWETDIYVNGFLSEYIPESLKNYNILLNKKNSYHDNYLFQDDEISYLTLKQDITRQKILDNMHNSLENEDFKIEDWVIGWDNFRNCYIIGKLKNIVDNNWMAIMEKVSLTDFIPKDLKTVLQLCHIQEQDAYIPVKCLQKLILNDEINKQEILNKMEVLTIQIDLALGFKYKSAFDNYVKEYKELENKLRDEVLV